MLIKLNHPTVIAGIGRAASGQILNLSSKVALPLIAAGNAAPRSFPKSKDDDSERAFRERKERARKAGQNVDWDLQPLRAGGVVRVWCSLRNPLPAPNESFKDKFSRAIHKRLAVSSKGQRQAHEQAEKDAKRYPGLHRRPRTKGE
jgi:hypothetical protein